MSAAPLYQITTVDMNSSQFHRRADKTVESSLTWQEVAARMSDSPDAHVDYALTALANNGTYSFHTADGKLCKVVSHKVL